jgi:hypothetical protein
LLERRVQLGGALLFRTQLNAELQQHSRQYSAAHYCAAAAIRTVGLVCLS